MPRVSVEADNLDRVIEEFKNPDGAPILRVRDAIVARIVDRPGRGLGAQRNTLTPQINDDGARILSTLSSPRQTGRAWGDKNIGIMRSLIPNVARKAAKEIEDSVRV